MSGLIFLRRNKIAGRTKRVECERCAEIEYQVACSKPKSRSWRLWVGMFFRRLADWLDGGMSVRFDITTQPRLEQQAINQCLAHSVVHMHKLLDEETRARGIDACLPYTNPDLYKDETQRS